MIPAELLFKELTRNHIDFFAGVPDSLLKDFCGYLSDHVSSERHIIAANEGNAVALAAGHYLGVGKPGLVYMQNSGLGNSVNPLISLCNRQVYGIPVLLLIGWRGEPGRVDEPQHVKQGSITPGMLEIMDIPWRLLESIDNLSETVSFLIEQMRKKNGPAALLVQQGVFSEYRCSMPATEYRLVREQVIALLAGQLTPDDLVVATTGKIARELWEYRIHNDEDCSLDFLTVGSMGHASSIALGIACSQPKRRVVCLDGDGSVLMHMGALTTIAQSKRANFTHVVLNNGAHDSVGGQPTCALDIDLPAVALACGYRAVKSVRTATMVESSFRKLLAVDGPTLLEVRISRGARPDLGRPTTTPESNRNALMKKLGVR